MTMVDVKDKDLRKLIREAEGDGWEFKKGGGAHIKGVHPATGRTTTISATPSDWRAILNIKRDLRRTA